MQRCIILASKIKELIKNVLPTDSKKVKIIVAIGLIGIVLILASEMFENDSSKQEVESDSISYEEYTAQLENRLTELISSIDGVGQCQVMITLENTTESVYATDIEIKNDDSSLNEKNGYVIYDSDDGETPVLIKEYLPKVQGVTVVCSGGDNTAVREKIIESVTSLFNISTNRISVSKIKS
jgi:stage III sporulation protein AG